MTKREVVFALCVWGKAYVETMLEVCLPSVLAPGNLPGVVADAEISLTVVTRPEDVAQIEASPAWQMAGTLCRTIIQPLLGPELFAEGNRYDVMAFGHRAVIADCLQRRAIMSVLSPDLVLGDGSLQFGMGRMLRGDKAVLLAGPRATLDYVVPALAEYRDPRNASVLAIPPRHLVAMLRRWPHAITAILFWEEQPFSKFPSAIYWKVGNESLVTRYFHLHPLFVDLAYANEAAARSGTVDGSLIGLANFPRDEIYICRNSDEICAVELSRLDHDPMGSLPVEVADKSAFVLDWATKYCDPSHRRQFLENYFLFQGREEIDWPTACARVAALTRDLDAGLAALDSAPRSPAPAQEVSGTTHRLMAMLGGGAIGKWLRNRRDARTAGGA